MEFLSSWIGNVLMFILLAVIVEMLLPQSNIQKYVKMVLGLLLIVIILTPIFQIFSVDVNTLLNQVANSSNEQNFQLENSIENKKKEIQATQDAYILEQAAYQLREIVEKELIEEFGLTFQDIQIVLNNMDGDFPENLKHISVRLKEYKDSNEIEEVQEVLVTMDQKPSNNDDQLITAVATFLSSRWDIAKETVNISIERGRAVNE
ncbi:stage III sporulation protein AF [Bacillus kwashiorkori]|uniref:stage III sporulation protein AF n=1 Tax=Bacillus kwashiorkori TaxID=1522318 RepID=UPI000780434B|nr:stage III sporulation protein AF [Bacillus kwashiorkori]